LDIESGAFMAITTPRIKKIKPVDPETLKGDLVKSGSELFGIIWINPQRLSGEPCFYGTRVPIKNLFDSLAAGESLDEFLEDFEGVSREQAEAVLDLAGTHLLAELPRP
jgi:uncharacterized protein (DUF433 family)